LPSSKKLRPGCQSTLPPHRLEKRRGTTTDTGAADTGAARQRVRVFGGRPQQRDHARRLLRVRHGVQAAVREQADPRGRQARRRRQRRQRAVHHAPGAIEVERVGRAQRADGLQAQRGDRVVAVPEALLPG